MCVNFALRLSMPSRALRPKKKLHHLTLCSSPPYRCLRFPAAVGVPPPAAACREYAHESLVRHGGAIRVLCCSRPAIAIAMCSVRRHRCFQIAHVHVTSFAQPHDRHPGYCDFCSWNAAQFLLLVVASILQSHRRLPQTHFACAIGVAASMNGDNHHASLSHGAHARATVLLSWKGAGSSFSAESPYCYCTIPPLSRAARRRRRSRARKTSVARAKWYSVPLTRTAPAHLRQENEFSSSNTGTHLYVTSIALCIECGTCACDDATEISV